MRSPLAWWHWLLGVEDIFAAIVFVYCPWTDTSLKGGRYFWYASTHYEWTVWPWKTRIKRLFNLIGSTRNNSMTTINPSTFNIIRWLAGSLEQTTQCPIVWCSKHYFFIISRALKTLYFYLKARTLVHCPFKMTCSQNESFSIWILNHYLKKNIDYTTVLFYLTHQCFDKKSSQL